MARRTAAAKKDEVTGDRRLRIVAPELFDVEAAYSRVASAATGSIEARKTLLDDLLYASKQGFGGLSAQENLEEALEQYELSLLVYSCVYQVHANSRHVPLVATRKSGGKIEDVPNSPLQQVIDEHPGSRWSTVDLIEQATQWMELAGSTVFVAATENDDHPEVPGRKLLGFRPLRPSQTFIIPGKPFIAAFEYDVDGRRTRIHPHNAELAKYPHPLDDFWGLAPLAAIGKTVQVDRMVEDFNIATLASSGVPEVALETPTELGKKERQRVRREFESEYVGSDRRAGVMVLDANLKLRELGRSPKDMEFRASYEVASERARGVFGVTPVMLMDFSAASVLANAAEQRRIFFYGLKSKLDRLAAAITAIVRRFFGPEWGVRFALEQVEMLKDHDAAREQARKDYLAFITTKNEARAVSGLPPVADGDSFHVEPVRAPAFGADNPPTTQPEAQQKETQVKAIASRPNHASGTLKSLARRSYLEQRSRWEPRLRSAIGEWLAWQKDFTLRALAPQAARERGLRVDPRLDSIKADSFGVDLDAEVEAVFDFEATKNAFRERVGPIFMLGTVQTANSKSQDLVGENATQFTEATDRVRSFVDSWTASHVQGVSETTRDVIRETLRKSYEEGRGASGAMLDLREKFDEMIAEGGHARADLIARTETTAMLNGGAEVARADLVGRGAKVVKSWLSVRDALVRDEHAELDEATSAEPIDAEKAFDNGLMFPGDPGGDAGDVANCRCTVVETVIEPPTE